MLLTKANIKVFHEVPDAVSLGQQLIVNLFRAGDGVPYPVRFRMPEVFTVIAQVGKAVGQLFFGEFSAHEEIPVKGNDRLPGAV
ncbi:MAG: hypothetical protein LBK62_11290 [Treponema sp.]|jgi:hypothetical protein|nr:hypothetical protein [Treponema sp.]